MKAIVVCALALVSLANGENGIEAALSDGLETSFKNPYEHLFRTRRTTENCVPGAIRFVNEPYDCHTCVCTEDGFLGLHWICTSMDCPLENSDQNQQSRDKRDAENERCSPGAIKSADKPFDCNSCFCEESGRWSCTLMACPPKHSDQNQQSRDKREIETLLSKGLETSFKNPYEHLFRTKRTTQICVPGSTKSADKPDDCNSCFCTDDGLHWGCTLMLCPPGWRDYQDNQSRSQ